MKWTETIVVGRPLAQVLRAVADENELMTWSAWPQATGYTCSVEGDGCVVGSTIVFRDSTGRVQGRQELTDVTPDRVRYRLRNRGPLGREITPELDFRFDAVDVATTRVHLDFRAVVPLPPGPRHLVDFLLGRRVRQLHVKDLQQLKAHVETAPATP